MQIDSSKLRQQCPGKATYRLRQDGGIEVGGELISHAPDSPIGKKIAKFWGQWGPLLRAASANHDVPLPWLVGIVTIESGGNPDACSPCIKYDKHGNQVCSFAPGCGGPCCAYGLMQVIDHTARSFCGRSGQSLLGNPGAAIDCGAAVYKAMLEKSLGDPIVAAKRYNGCGGCKGDKSPCNTVGIFGVGGQHNYAENFAKSSNAFLQMFPGEVGTSPRTLTSLAFFVVGAVGYWYIDKKYKLTDKAALRIAKAI